MVKPDTVLAFVPGSCRYSLTSISKSIGSPTFSEKKLNRMSKHGDNQQGLSRLYTGELMGRFEWQNVTSLQNSRLFFWHDCLVDKKHVACVKKRTVVIFPELYCFT